MSLPADDFYLICFEEQTGRSRVSETVAGLGLAGGLLGELVLGGHLVVHGGGLHPAGVAAPDDGLAREVLHVLSDQHQPRDLGTWLRFLATDAVPDVRHRMCTHGLLQQVRTRHLRVSARDRCLPTDSNAAAWPAIRLASQLCTGQPVAATDALLVGLVQATGLLGHVLWGPEHAPGFAYADRLRQVLPEPLAAVVAHTEAAVGQHVLTRRRM